MCEEKLTALRSRVKKCKQGVGITYKAMCDACGITTLSIMYNFTSGARDLPEEYIQGLDQFLKRFGY